LINEAEYLLDKAFLQTCLGFIESGLWPLAFYDCQIYAEGIMAEMGVTLGYFPNPYDWKEPCTSPPLCYDFSLIYAYLAQPAVIKALGVQGISWETCDVIPHLFLIGDWVKNLDVHIPTLLDKGKIRVLVYSGMLDYICNYLGGEAWTSQLNWKGKTNFNKTPFKNWYVKNDNKIAGHIKSSNGMTFLKIENAGHMVPMDQPKAALQMTLSFITNTTFF